jgi:hypothetical protein
MRIGLILSTLFELRSNTSLKRDANVATMLLRVHPLALR